VDGDLLLDGFPRTVAQAEALDSTLASMDCALDAVVLITAEDGAIVERICGRRTCASTGQVYHVKFMPPKVEGKDATKPERIWSSGMMTARTWSASGWRPTRRRPNR